MRCWGYKKTPCYSGLNLNQDKATKPQTVQIVRQGEATPYWFKFNPLYIPFEPSQNAFQIISASEIMGIAVLSW